MGARPENLCLVGPAGTGKSQLLAAGHAAVEAGHRVRYLLAAELVETLYRGLADNSVGKTIDTLLRNDVILVDEVGFAPLDATSTQLLFRFVAPRTNAAPSAWRRTGRSTTGAGSCPSTPPPRHCWTGCCTTPS